MICVAGFVCQSGPTVAILLPGNAWGIPYAPVYGFVAFTRQPLSWSHMVTRQEKSLSLQPRAATSLLGNTLGGVGIDNDGSAAGSRTA